jgi:hypothetical protein
MSCARYEVRLRGRLSERAQGAFLAMQFRPVPPQTLMFGELPESSDLCDLLAQCSAMGLEVVSVRRLPADPPETAGRSPVTDEVTSYPMRRP